MQKEFLEQLLFCPFELNSFGGGGVLLAFQFLFEIFNMNAM
jgi:hypothetical protein